MKRIGWCLFFLLCQMVGAEDYKDEQFSLRYPEGWKVIKSQKLVVFAPKENYQENTQRIMVKIEKIILPDGQDSKEELLKTYVPHVLKDYYRELRQKYEKKTPVTVVVDSKKVAEMIARMKQKQGKEEKAAPEIPESKDQEKSSGSDQAQLPKEVAKQIQDSEKRLAEVKKVEERIHSQSQDHQRHASERRNRIAEENKKVKVKPVSKEQFMESTGYKLEIEFTPEMETIQKIVYLGIYKDWLITLTVSYPEKQKLSSEMVASIIKSFTCSL
ncbi:MAG: cell envelope integrity protein TolA [Candidatus Brocadiae bacterium]|nr:cell envelope integrity protein TolA [Candidatus Brocadiia bacterium]